MSKTIKRFRQEPYGFFVDLDDAEAAVAVNPRTGEILLDEGIGDDRFHGAAISPTSFHEFVLEPESDGDMRLVLKFGRDKSHVLGTTENLDDASRWIRRATNAIAVVNGAAPSMSDPPTGSAPTNEDGPSRKATINARMLEILRKCPEATSWTVAEWAGHLNCSRAGIHATSTWKRLTASRKGVAPLRR